MALLMIFGLTSLYAVTTTVKPPIKAITDFMSSAQKGDTLILEPGIYKGTMFIAPGVVVISKVPFQACIQGPGKGTVVTMGTSSTIKDTKIESGTIGIFSSVTGASILNCHIRLNQQCGIMCVENLPKIEDCLIAHNRGSGIQGWDVRTVASTINHNTICYNGNNGISLGGVSNCVVENCIIAFNVNFGVKFTEETSKATLVQNCFYENSKFTGPIPEKNIGDNPLFVNAKKGDFSLQPQSKCIKAGIDGENIGKR